MDSEATSGTCPLTVARSLMIHRWETLTFLHWSYDPVQVQPLLPPGLTVQPYDGRAWVGLVPFHMRIRPPGKPPPPWVDRFCETNVRTYVTDQHGRSGVWFFSLDAERLPAVLGARATYRLPYFWARMELREEAGRITYRTRRRWPGPVGAGGTVVVRPGAAVPVEDVSELEHFLTGRWRLFSHVASGLLLYAEAEHPPWALRRVEVERWEDSLISAAGLPPPGGEPMAHYADGVDVRISRPRRVG